MRTATTSQQANAPASADLAPQAGPDGSTGEQVLVGLPHAEDSYYKDNAHLWPVVRVVEEFARNMIGALTTSHPYHCLEHTMQVVSNARAIASSLKLGNREFCLLILSAWLHDIGIGAMYRGHEQEGCRIAEEFLTGLLAEEEMMLVKEAIMATKLPQTGLHTVARVLCDADLFYLGTNLFTEWSNRLRAEHQIILGDIYTDREWIDVNIHFIRTHSFFTDYARDYCAAGVAYNLRMLEEMRTKA